MDDRQLIVLLINGDEKAFDALFKKYGAPLYRFSLDLTKDEEEAEEILQETFLKVWENRKKIDPGRNFRNYLITIAKNLILNIFRRRVMALKYQSIKDDRSQESPGIDEYLHFEELRKLLHSKIDLLSPIQREILKLKSDGYGNDEIATLLNMNKRNVEYHLGRAYARLRGEFKNISDIFPLFPSLIICLL